MNAELRLPTSGRDFSIFEAVHQEGASTWRLAEEHGISQTRVRQVVRRVAEWLADNLPVKTDEQRENDVRLAQHLAADRLQNLYREMMTRWRASNDTACIRQLTRLTLAMARLGVVAGTLEGVMADAEEEQGKAESGEPRPKAESGKRKAEAALADAAGFQSAIRNPQSAIPSAPPVRDFSVNSAKRDVQQRRQEFLHGGNTEASKGYVPLPRETEEEDIEAIENWIELLSDAGRRAAGVKPKAESGKPDGTPDGTEEREERKGGAMQSLSSRPLRTSVQKVRSPTRQAIDPTCFGVSANLLSPSCCGIFSILVAFPG